MTVPNEASAARKAAVYRLYAADGTLLYIGSSYDPDKRCEAHRRTPWWSEVAHRTDEWVESRWKAYSAETSAIWREQPKHNVAGTRTYSHPNSGAPAHRWRASYLAYTGRRDACTTDGMLSVYTAVVASAEGVDSLYVRRAERAAAELIEDVQGLGWDGRRRTVEKGRQLVIRALRNEGADDVDVATVMAIVHAQISQLPYLCDDEPHGSRRAEDGTVTYAVHAERGRLGKYWIYRMPALGWGAPVAESFDAIEEAARINISKWTGREFERVAVRIRTAE